MSDRITMIIPNQSGGVMDFANVMAERLDNARVVKFDESLNVDGDCVLLNASGYGYARYGAPFHLLNWVRRNKPRMKRFGVFMHEAYAVPTRITSSVFWVWRAQRFVASQLAKRSDFWISNTEYVSRWLETQAGDLPHLWMPVYSNVGELAELPATRKKMLVVFGSDAVRVNTWRAAGDALFRWADTAGIAVHDIGSPVRDPDLLAAMQSHGVVQHGRLPAGRLNELLAEATWGAVAYSPHDVAKSGIFATYCAHGVVPVLLSPNTGNHDGLVSGTHYLHGIPAVDPAPAEAARMAQAAYDWYQGHNVATCVAAIEKLLRPGAAPQP